MRDVLNMGGYGIYIWSAYAITTVTLGGAVLWCWQAWRAARAKLAALEGKS